MHVTSQCRESTLCSKVCVYEAVASVSSLELFILINTVRALRESNYYATAGRVSKFAGLFRFPVEAQIGKQELPYSTHKC